MIIYKNHTEVSVANLVINLATTKYFFALKKAPSLSLFINFFTKSLILNCNDSSTETSGKTNYILCNSKEWRLVWFRSYLKIISIQSDRRYCFLNASSTLRFNPKRIISENSLGKPWPITDITPAPPAKPLAKDHIITRNNQEIFGLSFKICMVCTISPAASLMANYIFKIVSKT
jgi:hypothetical protein